MGRSPSGAFGVVSVEVVACRWDCLQRPSRSGAARAAPFGLAAGAPSLAIAPLAGSGRESHGSVSAAEAGPTSHLCCASIPHLGRPAAVLAVSVLP